MNTLLCAIPYCEKDFDTTRRLLSWIAELGGCKNHSCLLGSDAAVPSADRDEIKKLASEAFGHVSSIVIGVGHAVSYQVACNRMWERMAHQIEETSKVPFLWLEPDCVPIKKGWLDDLAAAYAAQPRRYFGPIIDSSKMKKAPSDIKRHLAMVAIYPVDAHRELVDYTKGERAFDLTSHEFLPPRATDTRMILHFWPGPDQPAVEFKAVKTPEDPPHILTLARLWPETVLFHQCKNASLINVLRPKLIIPKDLSPDLKKLHPAAKAKP